MFGRNELIGNNLWDKKCNYYRCKHGSKNVDFKMNHFL